MLKVTKTSDGSAYLHVWREGEEYFRQKSQKFLTEWTNVMFVAVSQPPIENVFYIDISREPLEFPDNTFDAINAYHVFEHMTPQEGEKFAREIFRVSKPNAIFRVSVPDLESTCREYLNHLEVAKREPTEQNIYRYQWNVMEIFEQMVREKGGGMMGDALRRGDYDPSYIDQKFSDVYRPFLERVRRPTGSAPRSEERVTLLARLLRLTPARIYNGLKRRYLQYRVGNLWHPMISKERTRWMYDRVSLALLMRRTGFVQIRQKDFKNSDIPHWSKYDLDRSNFADRAIDPSVYVEGRKP
jgi:predicted SAM-dependent methyltransferase